MLSPWVYVPENNNKKLKRNENSMINKIGLAIMLTIASIAGVAHAGESHKACALMPIEESISAYADKDHSVVKLNNDEWKKVLDVIRTLQQVPLNWSTSDTTYMFFVEGEDTAAIVTEIRGCTSGLIHMRSDALKDILDLLNDVKGQAT